MCGAKLRTGGLVVRVWVPLHEAFFSDLKAERTAFRGRTFAWLRELCAQPEVRLDSLSGFNIGTGSDKWVSTIMRPDRLTSI